MEKQQALVRSRYLLVRRFPPKSDPIPLWTRIGSTPGDALEPQRVKLRSQYALHFQYDTTRYRSLKSYVEVSPWLHGDTASGDNDIIRDHDGIVQGGKRCICLGTSSSVRAFSSIGPRKKPIWETT